MNRRLVLSIVALVLSSAVGLVAAQDKAKTLTSVGVVAKIGGDSLSVDVGKKTMQFVTTTATEVSVTAGGAKAAAAKAAGEKGVKITDAVHVGDQVSVKYADVGGKLMVSAIDVLKRRPQSALPTK